MSRKSQFFMEIVVFAILAFYLFFRLWSVLGTRTGYEKKPVIVSNNASDNAVSILSSESEQNVHREEFSSAIASQIRQLQEREATFEPDIFLKAAQSAFQSIIRAYTNNNFTTLKKLLAPGVYEGFATAIDDRQKKNLRQETEISDLKATFLSVETFGDRALITVKFSSQQMTATYNEKGECVDNPSHITVTIVDVWTFEREINAQDPTWILVKTRSED